MAKATGKAGRRSVGKAGQKARPAPRTTPSRAGAGADTRSAREAKSAGRRDDILAAALDEFSERGFEAARLDDVAKRAGIAKGTIYLYFRDKETLFQELLRSMLMPIIGNLEAMEQTDVPVKNLAEHVLGVFVNDIFETRRKDVIRLMIAEGRRFPRIAEFYYREVLSRVFAALQAVLKRAEARGEVPKGLAEFPQLIAAPALLAIVWSGLFGHIAPLDAKKMMQTHIDILFAPRSMP